MRSLHLQNIPDSESNDPTASGTDSSTKLTSRKMRTHYTAADDSVHTCKISATSAPTRWMPTTRSFWALTTTFIMPLPSWPDKVSFSGLHPHHRWVCLTGTKYHTPATMEALVFCIEHESHKEHACTSWHITLLCPAFISHLSGAGDCLIG